MNKLKELGFNSYGNENNNDEWFYTYKKFVPFDDTQRIVLFFDKEQNSCSIWIDNVEWIDDSVLKINDSKYEHKDVYGYKYIDLHNAIGEQLSV